MFSPADIHALFETLRETFEVVDDQPTDSDVNHAVEALSQLLYPIPYDGENGKHNLIGLIMAEAPYIARFGEKFPRPKKVKAYGDIDVKLVGVPRAKAEALHEAKISDFAIFDAAERETRNFLLDTFDDAWYSELKKPITFYAEVRAKSVLNALQSVCLGGHEIDILDLQDRMRTMHTTHETIAQYILALEDAQKQAERAEQPITNAYLAMIATKAMLGSQRFPTADDAWEDLDKADRTWAKWKEVYKKADRKAKVRHKATDGQDQFGGAALGTGAGTP